MITKNHLTTYQGKSIYQTETDLLIAPHPKLQPFIANYTFTCPQNMAKEQTILPTLSNTLVYAIAGDSIIDGLRGVNTKPVAIGSYASQFSFMFLIEFHAGGFYPFTKIEQRQLVNAACSFSQLCPTLNHAINNAYYLAQDIPDLVKRLDSIFLANLDNNAVHPTILECMNRIQTKKGLVSVKELAKQVFYSEKQLNRIFYKYIGTNVKTFARIVRLKQAIALLDQSLSFTKVIQITEHYDPSHFVQDFKSIYAMTPKQYYVNRSLFYNDPYKLNSYTLDTEGK